MRKRARLVDAGAREPPQDFAPLVGARATVIGARDVDAHPAAILPGHAPVVRGIETLERGRMPRIHVMAT